MTRALAFIALSGLLVACASESSLGASEGTNAYDATSSPTEADTGFPSSTTTSLGVVPSSYALAATLEVADRGAQLVDLTVDFFDGADAPLCTYSFEVEPLVDAPPPADEPVLTWWDVTLSAPLPLGEACANVPDSWGFQLGVGDYDERLDPALTAAGLGDATGYGLYLQEAGGPVWITGIAATEAQQGGRAQPDPSVLAEGSYALDTLWLLPWSAR